MKSNSDCFVLAQACSATLCQYTIAISGNFTNVSSTGQLEHLEILHLGTDEAMQTALRFSSAFMRSHKHYICTSNVNNTSNEQYVNWFPISACRLCIKVHKVLCAPLFDGNLRIRFCYLYSDLVPFNASNPNGTVCK